MNQQQADLFEKLCQDPLVCNANAYFHAIGHPDYPTVGIDWMCRKDLADNGVCWCGKLRDETAQSDGSGAGA